MIMGNELTKAKSTAVRPSTSGRENFSRMMAVHMNAIETTPTGRRMIVAGALSKADLLEYARRIDEIGVGLAPGPPGDIKRRLALFFLGFGAPPSEDVVDAYTSILAGFPLWAIDRAIKAVINRGDKFRPSAPELHRLAEDEIVPFRAEAAQIKAITGAIPYSPPPATEERARVNAAIEAWRAEAKIAPAREDRVENPHTFAVETRLRAPAIGRATRLSDAALAALGIKPPEEKRNAVDL
jgi:hypothetical protein